MFIKVKISIVHKKGTNKQLDKQIYLKISKKTDR